MKDEFKVGDLVYVFAHGIVPFEIFDVCDLGKSVWLINLITHKIMEDVPTARLRKEKEQCFCALDMTLEQHGEFLKEIYCD